MNIKMSVITCLTVVFVSLILVFVMPKTSVLGNQSVAQTEIPVIIKPLKVENTIVPLEIICEPVMAIKPDTIREFSCKLINRTNKSIRASSVMYSVITESNGKEDRSVRLDNVDTFISPDFADLKKPIEPGKSLSIAPAGDITEPDSVIKRLEIEPVYIEFADGTTAGVAGKGAETIANVREGAAKYINALRAEFVSRGRLPEAILPLLENNAPIGFDAPNFAQETGAKQYRKLLRERLQKGGIRTITDVLNR